MKQEFYKYEIDKDRLLFRFESRSIEKTIEKIITYTPFPDNPEIYNLALGDILKNGEVSDLSVSNNDDMQKVMATVVRTRYKSVEAFIEAKLSESVENVKKINFNILKKKAASRGDF